MDGLVAIKGRRKEEVLGKWKELGKECVIADVLPLAVVVRVT